MADSPKLDAALLEEGGAGNEILVNEIVFRLEATYSIIDRDLATPPGSPTNGAAYLVATGGTGSWSGQDGNIAIYADGWIFLVPFEGLSVRVLDENLTIEYDGTNWSALDGLQTLTDGATINWDTGKGATASVTLGGDRTVAAPTNFEAGRTYTLRVRQDGTGTRLLTWNAIFLWAGGTAPTLSTGANDEDVFRFWTDGTSWYGETVGLNFG